MKAKLLLLTLGLASSALAMRGPVRRRANRPARWQVNQEQRDFERAVALSLQQTYAALVIPAPAQDDLQRALVASQESYRQEQERRRLADRQQQDDELQKALELSKVSFEDEKAQRAELERRALDRQLLHLVERNVQATYRSLGYFSSARAMSALLEEIHNLISQGANPNATDEHGDSALHKAIQCSNHQVVEALLLAGANPTRSDAQSTLLLIAAAVVNQPEVITFLLDNGAHINKQNENGCSALMKAAQYGSLDAIKTLVRAGANLHLKNVDGKTALTLALDPPSALKDEKPYDSVIGYLVAHGVVATPYMLLGVQYNASQRQIKKAYQQRVKKWHPDKAAALGFTKQEAQKMFLELQSAYNRLKKG